MTTKTKQADNGNITPEMATEILRSKQQANIKSFMEGLNQLSQQHECTLGVVLQFPNGGQVTLQDYLKAHNLELTPIIRAMPAG